MIRFSGSGSRRTSVGTARIWSPAASCGCSSRSMTSIDSGRQMRLADAFQIGERRDRLRCLTGDVKPQIVVVRSAGLGGG